jgi:hypothetical protein
VIRASSLAMLHDLNRAGLTASGGACQFEDLYREFQREGLASMRFFCFRVEPGGGRGAGPAALEKQLAAIPALTSHDGDEWQDHTNRGEGFTGGGADDLDSIQNGRFADLVVLDRDYLTVPADEINDINPVMTMVGGRVVFDAATRSTGAAP